MTIPSHAETLRRMAEDTSTYHLAGRIRKRALVEGAHALDTLAQHREALRRCHDLLTECESVIDPEEYSELTDRIMAELLPCDGTLECPTLPTPPEETQG